MELRKVLVSFSHTDLKRIVLQSIKDVNQSLVDDNLVETDKIGSGAFFWALPSKGFQSRQNLIDNVLKKTEEVKLQITETKEKIKLERDLRDPMDGERDQMLKELSALQKSNSQLTSSIQQYERCDPKRLEELAVNTQVCKAGMTRWTDNLYEMESWIKKHNPGMNSEEIYQNFPILRDLDYLE